MLHFIKSCAAFVAIVLTQICWARYNHDAGIEEHESLPPLVQLMVTSSNEPLDPAVLEEFKKDAFASSNILLKLGKQELRTLSKLTGRVIGSDLLFGIPVKEGEDPAEQITEGVSSPSGDEGGKTQQTVNQYVTGKPSLTAQTNTPNLDNTQTPVLSPSLPGQPPQTAVPTPTNQNPMVSAIAPNTHSYAQSSTALPTSGNVPVPHAKPLVQGTTLPLQPKPGNFPSTPFSNGASPLPIMQQQLVTSVSPASGTLQYGGTSSPSPSTYIYQANYNPLAGDPFHMSFSKPNPGTSIQASPSHQSHVAQPLTTQTQPSEPVWGGVLVQ